MSSRSSTDITLAGLDLLGEEFIPLVSHTATVNKDYKRLMQFSNVTSYSKRNLLHACPRKYLLSMHAANAGHETDDFSDSNLNLCFGHAVGAGVQNYMQTKDLDKAILAATLAWTASLEDRIVKKKKSLWEAIIAVELFAQWEALEDWEIFVLPTGKPAVELAFSFHTMNGYKEYGHIDLVLKNRYTGQLATFDVKTTGKAPEEADYANSSQLVGYSVMLHAIVPELSEYVVHYPIYSSELREWTLMSFEKDIATRAEWVKDLMLDHSALQTYKEIGFYPKRGNACYSYFKRCQFFGECDNVSKVETQELPADQEAEEVDWVVDIRDVIEQLKSRAQS